MFDTSKDYKREELHIAIHAFENSKWARIRSHAYMLVLLPILLPVHLSLLLWFTIARSSSFSLGYSYLKLYFFVYYYFGGVKRINTFPTPQSPPTKPTIFFTTKNYALLPCFLTTLFSYPVALPFSQYLKKLPINFFFPFVRFHSLITLLGYDDQPLAESLPLIQENLKNNIPTVVYINPDIVTPTLNEELPIYKDILSLLDTSIECYFLACKGLDMIHAGSIFFPSLVSIHCKSANELFEGADAALNPELEKYSRLTTFFNYQNFKLV